MIATSLPLTAQNQPSSRPWSIDITPQAGYRTRMTFDTETQVQGGPTPQIILDSNPAFGVAFGARFNHQELVEFRWSREDTEMHITNSVAFPRQRVLLDQFHFNFSHEYVLREWPIWARPFVMGSAGWTRISSTAATNSFTRFSFGVGGGVKAFPSPHFGVVLQAQWLPLWVTPEVKTLCNVACVIQLGGQLASQAEVSIGPVIRF